MDCRGCVTAVKGFECRDGLVNIKSSIRKKSLSNIEGYFASTVISWPDKLQIHQSASDNARTVPKKLNLKKMTVWIQYSPEPQNRTSVFGTNMKESIDDCWFVLNMASVR
jgi:hypothetical protein